MQNEPKKIYIVYWNSYAVFNLIKYRMFIGIKNLRN